jgi:hypothetical protein
MSEKEVAEAIASQEEHIKRTKSCQGVIGQAHHFRTFGGPTSANPTWQECFICHVTKSALDYQRKLRKANEIERLDPEKVAKEVARWQGAHTEAINYNNALRDEVRLVRLELGRGRRAAVEYIIGDLQTLVNRFPKPLPEEKFEVPSCAN